MRLHPLMQLPGLALAGLLLLPQPGQAATPSRAPALPPAAGTTVLPHTLGQTGDAALGWTGPGHTPAAIDLWTGWEGIEPLALGLRPIEAAAPPRLTYRLSTKSAPRQLEFSPLRANPRAARLRHLVGYAEARRDGHDAVQYGARIRPAKKPTQMTLAEIEAWTRATPGQHHAIGRYQFIPKTLRRLVRKAGLADSTRFTPAVQDALADILLEEAGFTAFQSGQLGRRTFMRNLAQIWAGLPTANGRSYYHGHAGNRATISWANFDTEIRRIFAK
ncbi:MAG: hypothetical protein ABNH26_03895 [Celeribacter sp.]